LADDEIQLAAVVPLLRLGVGQADVNQFPLEKGTGLVTLMHDETPSQE
jgi:hypothetical protein